MVLTEIEVAKGQSVQQNLLVVFNWRAK